MSKFVDKFIEMDYLHNLEEGRYYFGLKKLSLTAR